jgi:hypothetical protein
LSVLQVLCLQSQGNIIPSLTRQLPLAMRESQEIRKGRRAR